LTSPQEVQWVLRAQLGEREAIELLLRSIQPMLTGYVRAIVGARDAEDVTQEVMVRMYRKLWTLTSAELFRPWMFRIASREAFRHLKKARRWPDRMRDDDSLDDVAAPLEISTLELDALLTDDSLTPASRAVLALHFKEGMTLAEVAAVLDIPIGTAKSRLHYGLATLRRRLNEQGGRHD
jgi:RNA polymerase sigma-70 factor (ECF subfamily)